MKIYDSKGFTLIELLIVIVIIGILSSILLSNFIGVRQRARDGTRKSDLRQIQAALELYRADYGTYPLDSGDKLVSSCGPGNSFTDSGTGTVYMKTVPCDPLGASAPFNGGNYLYDSDGVNYTLEACLENGSDSQGIKSPPKSGTCLTINKDGGTGWYHVLTNP